MKKDLVDHWDEIKQYQDTHSEDEVREKNP
jgi:hypothetical protein